MYVTAPLFISATHVVSWPEIVIFIPLMHFESYVACYIYMGFCCMRTDWTSVFTVSAVVVTAVSSCEWGAPLTLRICLWLSVPGSSSRGFLLGLASWRTRRPRASCPPLMMTVMVELEQMVRWSTPIWFIYFFQIKDRLSKFCSYILSIVKLFCVCKLCQKDRELPAVGTIVWTHSYCPTAGQHRRLHNILNWLHWLENLCYLSLSLYSIYYRVTMTQTDEVHNQVSHVSHAFFLLHRVPGHGLVLNNWTPSQSQHLNSIWRPPPNYNPPIPLLQGLS